MVVVAIHHRPFTLPASPVRRIADLAGGEHFNEVFFDNVG